MNEDTRRRLMRAPYLLGGRDLDGIDCLGTVLFIARERGAMLDDPWSVLEEQWQSGGVDVATAMPAHYHRVDSGERLQDLDVMLFDGVHPWVAIVSEGLVWSANEPSGGVYCRVAARWKARPRELWRFRGSPC